MDHLLDNGTKMYHNGAMNKATSSTIKINLPEGILENSTQEAKRIGISVQDFIRMLLATYFSRSEAIATISRDKILLQNAKKEISQGQYKEFSNQQELEEYLLKL